MAEDLLSVLSRFHREVVVPDIERIVDAKITPLREEMLANFDAVFKRLDRLVSEYHALSAALRRLEERMGAVEQRLTAVEQKLDKMALRSELIALEERVQALEQRITELKAQLS